MTHQSEVTVYQLSTEAGTHFAGQCLAPNRILEGLAKANERRTTGLRKALTEAGYDVIDGPNLLGTLSEEVRAWTPSSKFAGARNEDNALQVCKAIYDGLQRNEPQLGPRPNNCEIFLGGDCSITPSILAGLHARNSSPHKIGVLYMDGDVDLTLPRPSSSLSGDGSSMILDSMVMTHLTRRVGGLKSMEQFCKFDGSPLVEPSNIVLFGFDPLQPSPEHFAYLLDNGFRCFSRPTVRRDPVTAAKAALDWLKQRCDTVYLHFDVDVIDCAEFPLANYPHYAGLHHSEAWAALKVFLQDDQIRTLVVTEVNPNNDPQGWMVQELVDAIASGLTARLA